MHERDGYPKFDCSAEMHPEYAYTYNPDAAGTPHAFEQHGLVNFCGCATLLTGLAASFILSALTF